MTQDKNSLRRTMRARRRALSAAQRQDAAHGLKRELSRQLRLSRFARVAAYLSNDGELDPREVIAQRWRARRRVYLPVIHRAHGLQMRFALYDKNTVMRPNRFGINEPQCTRAQLRSAQRMGAILIPLVAFDATGNRVGMGGGYYDRTLSFIRQRKRWQGPLLIGVAYDFQQVDALPADPWDVPLHYIVTPSRVIRVK